MLILIASVALLAAAGTFIYADISRNTSTVVEGERRVISQVLSDSIQQYVVDEALFTFELPGDWEEFERRSTDSQNSITWQEVTEGQAGRVLTLYIDAIPAEVPVNRLLPVTAQGPRLTFGTVSDPCYTFTGEGTANVREAVNLRPAPAKWQGVDFLCNLTNPVTNIVATGSIGVPTGTDIVGLNGESHRYLFVYNDQNIQPKYSILINAIRSFTAK